jgi:hypothetical protein
MKFSLSAALVILFPQLIIAQAYWQQKVDTRINVRLDDVNHMLYGFEELNYTNNSPDTLNSIYLHLWPNAFKNDLTAYEHQQDLNRNTSFYYSKKADKGYIDSLDFTVNGLSVEHYSAEQTPDITRIDLPRPLLPGQMIKLSTPFKVKLPIVFSRLGHTGQAYYISQWFPKPAVYDKGGWHPLPYLDLGEYYSEYGSYDVAITLPENYVLMATGNCQDQSENDWLDSLAKLPVPTGKFNLSAFPASSGQLKTVHFHEDNVHDFAWFADKRWVVRKDTVQSPGTGDIVTAWAAFWPSYSATWEQATQHLKSTVKYYGTWVGPYPYKTIKAVLGNMRAGGGMEYPTITVIDKSANIGFRTVLVHEAGHNWFYGILGSNERDNAWMDEGLNTFFEKKTNAALGKEAGLANILGKLNEDLFYYELAATHNDQPITTTSADFSKLNYGIDVYYKTALMLKWLEQYMGEEQFLKGIHHYYDSWHHKHPQPNDFRACMQQYSDKPIDWYFDGALHTTAKIDYLIKKAKVNDGQTTVTVKNNSSLKAPVLVEALIDDSVVDKKWTEPFTGTTTLNFPVANWTTLEVANLAPDAKSTNDVYRRHGLLHHFGITVQPIAGLNLAEKDRIFISPAVGYNQYDGTMAGLVLHDLTLPENRFRFAISPLYSFAGSSLTGTGAIGYMLYPSNGIKEVLIQAEAKSFHNNETRVGVSEPLYTRYIKTALSANITLKEGSLLSTVNRNLLVKGYAITDEDFVFGTAATQIISTERQFGLMRYTHENDRTYNAFRYSFEAHGSKDFVKLSVEGTARIDFHRKNKGLTVRGFAGKFISINSDPAAYAKYLLNTSYSAINDYLYDGTYLGRNATSGTASKQIATQEGGFKIPLYNSLHRSDNWMATINLSSDLPFIRLPVKLFLDAGLMPNARPDMKHNSTTTLMYDGGIELSLVRNYFSIYFPVIMSGDLRDYITNTWGSKSFAKSISFTLNLQNIDWLKSPTHTMRSLVN